MPRSPKNSFPDVVRDGQCFRWCTQCTDHLPLDRFLLRHSGQRRLLCRTHLYAENRAFQSDKLFKIVVNTKAFCRRVGIKCELTTADVHLLWAQHDLDSLRLVPADPSRPLGLENVSIVPPHVWRVLASLLRRGKDPVYYEKMLEHSRQKEVAVAGREPGRVVSKINES
jgi:hypothetical protein